MCWRGLVLDLWLRGHSPIGIEGSDYSRKIGRAEWVLLKDRLFTADVTKPFWISNNSERAQFDLITAWELLEHLPEAGLDQFFQNIVMHLRPGGLFIASIATFEDLDPVTGANYHVTLKEKAWWLSQMMKYGLKEANLSFVLKDFARGSGSGPFDWDGEKNPELGFHVVMKRDI